LFTVLYRWRLDPELTDQFVESWSAITEHYLEHCGSHGSRLHKGIDGLYYSYAQWPDSLTREKATLDVRLELAALKMKEAIVESFPEVILETVADHLKPPTSTE